MSSPEIVVSAIHCYPVKSCRGISLTTATVGEIGIMYDRQWMVVNSDNVFVAQRGDKGIGATGVRTMCLIVPTITDTHLQLTAPDMEPLVLPLEGVDNGERTVRVWQDWCKGIDQGEEAAEWFTAYLSREQKGAYRLVRMPDAGTRHTELGNDKVGFADGYPFLLTSEATLQHLNSHLEVALPMNRFRPNIVLQGGGAFVENELGPFRINGIEFFPIKKDGRCPITTIDQTTGLAGKEPLATFGRLKENNKYVYREGNQVYFGMYLTHAGRGVIQIGDRLES